MCERVAGSRVPQFYEFELRSYLVLVHSCARAALDVACFLVVADVERAFDDKADYLRREAAGEFRCEGRSEGVEVVALVGAEAARRDNFPEVNVVGFGGEGGAGAQEDREEAVPLVFNCAVQGRVALAIYNSAELPRSSCSLKARPRARGEHCKLLFKARTRRRGPPDVPSHLQGEARLGSGRR